MDVKECSACAAGTFVELNGGLATLVRSDSFDQSRSDSGGSDGAGTSPLE